MAEVPCQVSLSSSLFYLMQIYACTPRSWGPEYKVININIESQQHLEVLLATRPLTNVTVNKFSVVLSEDFTVWQLLVLIWYSVKLSGSWTVSGNHSVSEMLVQSLCDLTVFHISVCQTDRQTDRQVDRATERQQREDRTMRHLDQIPRADQPSYITERPDISLDINSDVLLYNNSHISLAGRLVSSRYPSPLSVRASVAPGLLLPPSLNPGPV